MSSLLLLLLGVGAVGLLLLPRGARIDLLWSGRVLLLLLEGRFLPFVWLHCANLVS